VIRRGHLLSALADPGFRRLFAVRLACQFGDGIFQASLAGAVLFNPERQAHAADIASGFAVLLVPYSLIGPFTGVLLDRWWRQRVFVAANVLRAGCVLPIAAEIAAGWGGVAFYASALVVISISRFVLAALSASLPHVVAPGELVTANAVSTTCGTIAAVLGGAAAIGVRAVIGDENGDYALIALATALAYVLAAGIARAFARDTLGPDDVERSNRETVADVALGLVAGAQHIRSRPAVARALAVIGIQRLGYGVTVVCTVLLYRNYFHGHGPFRAGLAGLTQVVALTAAGGALAAVVTPTAFRRVGIRGWVTALLAGAALTQLGCVLAYRLPLSLLAALLLGLVAQGIKISVDTLVQQQVADAYRGRVFSLYDTLFNLALVGAAVLTALVLPENGRSPVSVLVIAGGYVAVGTGYAMRERRTTTAATETAARPTRT
jgi:MFS family permease